MSPTKLGMGDTDPGQAQPDGAEAQAELTDQTDAIPEPEQVSQHAANSPSQERGHSNIDSPVAMDVAKPHQQSSEEPRRRRRTSSRSRERRRSSRERRPASREYRSRSRSRSRRSPRPLSRRRSRSPVRQRGWDRRDDWRPRQPRPSGRDMRALYEGRSRWDSRPEVPRGSNGRQPFRPDWRSRQPSNDWRGPEPATRTLEADRVELEQRHRLKARSRSRGQGDDQDFGGDRWLHDMHGQHDKPDTEEKAEPGLPPALLQPLTLT